MAGWNRIASSVALLAGGLLMPAVGAESLPRLRVSDNQHFLVTAEGRPFFYLADTAWELFHRLNREEADRYLATRATQGFTAIQAVALAELDGVRVPNAYGHLPLVDNDPTRPLVKPGPADDYWDHVDYIVRQANSRGLYVAFLPTWGDKWNIGRGAGPALFNPQNAAVYGHWLGQRYRDAGVIWVLGGDRRIETEEHQEIIRAMARGLREGDGGVHLCTFHPRGGGTSSDPFHRDDWLAFNMRQNGHGAEYTQRYGLTRDDYDLKPPKPVIDGEPLYEDHPVGFKAADFGYSCAADIRRALYWDLFSGACGHTYGNHSVWQMWQPDRKGVNNPILPWYEAIHREGAAQMQYARWLLESRPVLSRVPDDSVIVPHRVPAYIPGAGRTRLVATRDARGRYALVYVPLGRTFAVRMDAISGPQVKAWWFNPRDGQATAIGTFANTGQREFSPPAPGEVQDWVLVLDDVAQNFPPPGTRGP